MKKVLAVVVAIAAVVVVAHAALAFMGPRHWAGMGHPMMMQMGSHMMGQGAGPMGPGMHGGAMPATPSRGEMHAADSRERARP